jgi:hypothetical protein
MTCCHDILLKRYPARSRLLCYHPQSIPELFRVAHRAFSNGTTWLVWLLTIGVCIVINLLGDQIMVRVRRRLPFS